MKPHFIFASALFALASATHCDPAKNNSKIQQETDDRRTAANANLVNVAPKIEAHINAVLNETRAQAGITSNQPSQTENEAFLKLVAKNLGTYVKGSGVTIADIVQLTNLEIWMEQNLSKDKNEMHRFPFRCSRYRVNPLGGIPGITSVPANLNEKTANHTIAGIVNLNGVYVGTDKFAHIWAVGKKIFDLNLSEEERWKLHRYLEGDPSLPLADRARFTPIGLRADPAWGIFGVYGSFPTGVISKADMYANEVGITFYTRLSQQPLSYEFHFADFPMDKLNEQNVPNTYVRGVKTLEEEGCLPPKN